MCDCRVRGRMPRGGLGSLKTDVALTDQIAGHSPVASLEIMPIKEGVVGVCNALLQSYFR
jgi:hypothetical protein